MNYTPALSRLSVLPMLVPNRETIKKALVVLPFGHEPIHQRLEPFAVSTLKEVDHLMNDDVLQALHRFANKVSI